MVQQRARPHSRQWVANLLVKLEGAVLQPPFPRTDESEV